MVYAIMALLGSTLAACWVDTLETKLAIDSDVIRSIPVPDSSRAWDALGAIGVEISQAAAVGADLTPLTQALDRKVNRALGLPEALQGDLIRLFAGFTAPEGAIRYRTAPDSRDVGPTLADEEQGMHFGAVLGVEGPRLRIWIPGLTSEDGTLTEPPPQFMGRHAIEGATFDVAMRTSSIEDGVFAFQRRSYETPDRDVLSGADG